LFTRITLVVAGIWLGLAMLETWVLQKTAQEEKNRPTFGVVTDE
jgi:hypothetical protein